MPTLWVFEARQCNTIFTILLLWCLKPPLPKFQRLFAVCLVTGDNTCTCTDFFPLACLANAFFYWSWLCSSWLANFTLYYLALPWSMRFFLVAVTAEMLTQYPDVLALMSGFAAHNCSFVTKIQKKTSGTKGNLVWFLLDRKIVI